MNASRRSREAAPSPRLARRRARGTGAQLRAPSLETCLHTKTTFWKSLVWIFHLYLFFLFWDHVKHHYIIDRLFQTKETWCDQKQSANGYIGQRLVRFGQSSPFLAVLWDILALIRRDHTLTRPMRAFSDALTSYPSRIHGRCRRSYLFVI